MAKKCRLIHINDIMLRREILKIGTHFLLCAPIKLINDSNQIGEGNQNENYKETVKKNY